MNQLEALARSYIEWMSWVGQDPLQHALDEKTTLLNSPQFTLTYHEKLIVRGIDNLKKHFADAFKDIGHWHHEISTLEVLSDYSVLANYTVVTEHKGAVPCDVIFFFINQVCVGMHEVKVNLAGVLNVDEEFIRTC